MAGAHTPAPRTDSHREGARAGERGGALTRCPCSGRRLGAAHAPGANTRLRSSTHVSGSTERPETGPPFSFRAPGGRRGALRACPQLPAEAWPALGAACVRAEPSLAYPSLPPTQAAVFLHCGHCPLPRLLQKGCAHPVVICVSLLLAKCPNLEKTNKVGPFLGGGQHGCQNKQTINTKMKCGGAVTPRTLTPHGKYAPGRTGTSTRCKRGQKTPSPDSAVRGVSRVHCSLRETGTSSPSQFRELE